MTIPSSLIFVAIVVLWAGWLLQHQIRRRQLLLTARNVETFSDAMRVLERRAPMTVSAMDPSAVSPRPSLRAGTMLFGEQNEQEDRPELTNRAPRSFSDVFFDAPAADETSEAAMTGDSATSAKTHEMVVRLRRVVRMRRTRGIALLIALALFPLTLIGVIAGGIASVTLLGSVILIGAVVLWLRTETIAEARRSGRAAPARPQLGRTRHTPEAAPLQAPARDRGVVAADTVAASTFATGTTVAADIEHGPQLTFARSDVPFDGDPAPVAPQVPATTSATSTAGSSDTRAASTSTQTSAADGTWSPVQVPKPTYTMKAKAPERAEVAAASYANVPVEELPFDGLALDPEEEDLPSVFRAG